MMKDLVIRTTKTKGPVDGTFSASGAFDDNGTLITEEMTHEEVAAGLETRLRLRLEGEYGSFTIRASIIETWTEDRAVLANKGTWTIVTGTGAYVSLRGGGTVEGTVDDNTRLVCRTYSACIEMDAVLNLGD